MTIETLDEWLQQEGIVPAEGPGAIADVGRVRGLLIDAARRGEAVSYADVLGLLGFRFSRPKMRAVCKTRDAIEAKARADGEPALAVLVVRESDRLPGQGWWTGATAGGYEGGWTGCEADAHVRKLQKIAFDFWATY